jgi:hypothetical protein
LQAGLIESSSRQQKAFHPTGERLFVGYQAQKLFKFLTILCSFKMAQLHNNYFDWNA